MPHSASRKKGGGGKNRNGELHGDSYNTLTRRVKELPTMPVVAVNSVDESNL